MKEVRQSLGCRIYFFGTLPHKFYDMLKIRKNYSKRIFVLGVLLFVGLCFLPVLTGAEQRPLIGITCMFYDNETEGFGKITVSDSYVQAVIAAGGIPVVLPPVTDETIIRYYLDLLDGVVLTGGMDIPPEFYDDHNDETVNVMSERRFAFEKQFITEWIQTKKPVLGVCLGIQFVNVVREGTLIQDIPSEIDHAETHRSSQDATHPIIISEKSYLADILGDGALEVNSSHHQAVKNPGKGLKVVATSPDGVVEAMEFEDYPFGLLVQWHPERMPKRHRDAIYGALVEACVIEDREPISEIRNDSGNPNFE
ncbi:gamma-glutamyl-gamma-aminobutyrate hydrolase family protein [PVC group bacterium]|nr:gamma-glutamyl-gamma-aminobutyrate hydrolase family protein [PVC group bacterium]